MRSKWNKWLNDIDGVVDVCIREMNEIAPETKNGASYESIARKWFTEMPLHAYSLSHFDSTDGYQIQLQEWRKKFSHRYNRKYYWYKWFEKNYPIYQILMKGNEYKGNTRVMIHPDQELVVKTATPQDIANTYIGEVYIGQEVDKIDIDLDNLQRFVKQSERNLTALQYRGPDYVKKIKRNIIHALKLIKLAQHFDETVVNPMTGDIRYVIPQPYKISPFGRKYYTGGFALQNKSEAVRTAALGRCWSIDIDSSVFRFYKWLAVNYGVEHHTLDILLADKNSFRAELASCLHNVSTDQNYLIKLVKQSITALGFGARDTSFWDPTTKKQSAIAEIIKNPEDRERLTDHPYWRDLKRIYNEIKTAITKDRDFVNEYKQETVFWEKNKYTPDRLMSLLYQQYESNLMKLCIELLDEYQREPKLWVHDGVYTLMHPMKNGEMHVIESILQKEINPYVKFEITEHKPYLLIDREEIAQQDLEHQQRIYQQEQAAKQWAANQGTLNTESISQRVAGLRMRNPELYRVQEDYANGSGYDGSGYNGSGYTAPLEEEN